MCSMKLNHIVGLALFTALAIPFAVIPTAFGLALVQYVTGIAAPEWAATVLSIPLAIHIARNVNAMVQP